jgi:glycosyltransferase involved in cell wall biosynthesis
MKKNIELTIIIPIFNFKKKNLSKFLINLKLLKKKNLDDTIEILIINNKKNKNENKILENYVKKKLDIYILNFNKEGNPGLARNYGLKKSKGENILFLDFDDKLNVVNLLNLVKSLKNSYDIFIFKYHHNIWHNNNLHKNKISKFKIIKNILKREYDESPNYYIFKKKFLIRNKILFSSGFYEDRIFILKCFVYAKIIKKTIKLIYTKIYRKKSITNTISNKHIVDFINSSINKYLFIKKLKKKRLFDHLQYGLRGDFNQILKKSSTFKNNFYRNFITECYSKIINKNFIPKTSIDLKIKNILINEKT